MDDKMSQLEDFKYTVEWSTCVNILSDLFLQYKDNPYGINKINGYVSNLPNFLQKAIKEKDEKDKRRENLRIERDIFTTKFLQSHNYYYSSNTLLFFHYDGLHFNIYNEDDIQYEILTSITDGQFLMTLKHKIKNNIMKQIKDKCPLTLIPESDTIQYVINNLYPSIFRSKDSVKYFLTIIGDNILKKNDNLVYIISPNAKNILNDIITQCYNLIGTGHAMSSIKYKYYDHNYQDCRLIMTNDISKKTSLDRAFYKNILDLLCVACHYSNRYGCADNFIETCNNEELINYTLYLKNNNFENIIDEFLNVSIEKCNGTSVSWKNVLYLWKNFLNKKNIPNVAFNSKVKSVLSQKLEYNQDLDVFNNITSTSLPLVSNFLKFWEENITKDEDEIEIEIDEICSMFKNWSGKTTAAINEDVVVDLIQHFYPDIQIEDDKYIPQMSCKVWDKRCDIIYALEEYKTNQKSINNTIPVTLYNMYEYYCKIFLNKPYIVSKRYFEKFTSEYIEHEHLDNDQLVLPTWWSN
jgi:hypothetical protein